MDWLDPLSAIFYVFLYNNNLTLGP